MITKTILILVSMFVLSIGAESQKIERNDQVPVIVQAKYGKEDLSAKLSANVNYPEQGKARNLSGDVIIKVRVSKAGLIDSLVILSTPDFILSTSSIITLNSLLEGWKPATINNEPVDKNYKVVFRYKILSGSQPVDYKKSAEKSAKKEKYEKALELYNRAELENPYDYKLFESRSAVRELIGDREGAEKDKREAARLENEVLLYINVSAYGLQGYERKQVTTERLIRSEIVVKESR